MYCYYINFNCTIQELKPRTESSILASTSYFNCTIQELKRAGGYMVDACGGEFQLHHTGIKT